MVYINTGSATVTVNEKVFNLKPRECVFIHSNDIHCIRSDKTAVITVLKAKSKYFEKVFTSKKLASPFISKDLNVEDFLSGVRTELSSDAYGCGVMADCLSTQFFITILREQQTVSVEAVSANQRNSKHELYTEICKKIYNEYKTITFEEAARYMNFSKPHFSKEFHGIFGMTFTRYLHAVRVAAAIERLRQGDESITAVSSDCGFNTIRNFNRVFKELTGYSPKNLPADYVFLYSLQEGCGLDPTLNCTEIL